MKPAATEPRYASLTGGLLARKGQAKPAMRPGGTLGYPAPVDDLGWNDMGAPAAPAVPEPVRQQEEIAASLAVVREVVAVEPPARLPAGSKAKAAFTLRLDAERHLRLRLACAVSHRSAQALLTQALDALLETMPAPGAMTEARPAPGEA